MSVFPVTDPLERFHLWLREARAHPQISEPTAMCLATSTPSGTPSARIVLLKGADAGGFVFYTNTLSRKGGELAHNPQAALCFYWMPLRRQVRVEGTVAPVQDTEADAYFASRPRVSRLGAWASRQSQPLESRELLLARLNALEDQYPGDTIPRPPHWHGYRLTPQVMEFWQEADFRLHDREVFRRDGTGPNGQAQWQATRLNP